MGFGHGDFEKEPGFKKEPEGGYPLPKFEKQFLIADKITTTRC
jgi:hypothetical protein